MHESDDIYFVPTTGIAAANAGSGVKVVIGAIDKPKEATAVIIERLNRLVLTADFRAALAIDKRTADRV